jgi:hypothetical protein
MGTNVSEEDNASILKDEECRSKNTSGRGSYIQFQIGRNGHEAIQVTYL